jgi:hypothetical protein
MRLLLCRHCRTLEELADYEGPPEYDRLLEELVNRHNKLDARAHEGNVATLMHVENRDWEMHRDSILERMRSKDEGFGEPWIKDAMDTYKEDALKCYSRHGRPKDGCGDYWSDSKRIGRPTPEGRAVLKTMYKLGERDPHLCQFCPVHTFVQTEINWTRGLYKEG